jgi:hypothetical protein
VARRLFRNDTGEAERLRQRIAVAQRVAAGLLLVTVITMVAARYV